MQVELTEQRRAERGVGGHAQRPVHRRGLRGAEELRACGARSPPSSPTRCARTPPGRDRGRPVGPRGRRRAGRQGQAGVVRFIGVDGYRWMIRCVVNGPQENVDALATEAREALADTVVRRGETPLPVRTPLPVELPEPMADAVAGRRRSRPPPSRPRSRRPQPPEPPQPAAAAASRDRRCSNCAPSPAASAASRRRAGRHRHARPAPPGRRPCSSSVTVRNAARGAAVTHSTPTSAGCTGSSRRRCDAHRDRQPRQLAARRCDVVAAPLPSRRAATAIGRPMTGSAPRPATAGSTPASGRRPTPARRGAARSRSAWRPCAAGAESGAPVHARQRGEHRDRAVGMSNRPRGGHRCADRHPADRDRRRARRVVQRGDGSHRRAGPAGVAV